MFSATMPDESAVYSTPGEFTVLDTIVQGETDVVGRINSYLTRRLGMYENGQYKIPDADVTGSYYENLTLRKVINLCNLYTHVSAAMQVIREDPDGFEMGGVFHTPQSISRRALDTVCSTDIENVAGLVSFTFENGSFHVDVLELVTLMDILVDELQGISSTNK